jgi:hypothetical protein
MLQVYEGLFEILSAKHDLVKERVHNKEDKKKVIQNLKPGNTGEKGCRENLNNTFVFPVVNGKKADGIFSYISARQSGMTPWFSARSS